VTVRSVLAFTAGLGLALTACGGGDSKAGDTGAAGGGARSGSVDLTGAGATFPYPIYSRWFSDYDQQKGVRINYGSLGSGAGIRQLSEQTVDFGASDSPMTDEELAAAKGGAVLHVPTVIGGVVVAYNVPAVAQPLKLTGDVIADLFLGRITKWNDPRIAATNPGVQLPNADVLVVHRTDASGTTYIFTDYLTAVSQPWAGGPGRGKQVSWPTGLGAKGNEGVAAQVKQTENAIGYVELAYAKQNRLQMAEVRNQAGSFVPPTIENIQASAASALETLPANTDFRVSIVNAPGAQSYPISSFTWILIYRQQPDSVKGRKLTEFLRWALAEGDAAATALDYAPLPAPLEQRVLQRLDSLQVGGAR
jgi:phosphate transport system substrate-binding protein